jgi:hypothetical protein
MSGHHPVPRNHEPLDAAEIEFLDYLVTKAIESCIPSAKPIFSLSLLDSLPRRKRNRHGENKHVNPIGRTGAPAARR